MTTRQYCLALLEEVDAAGRDPDLAYLVRTRLRRSIVALERGRHGDGGYGCLGDAPQEIREIVAALGTKAMRVSQPSEALNTRWVRDWQGVLADVEALRDWLARVPGPVGT